MSSGRLLATRFALGAAAMFLVTGTAGGQTVPGCSIRAVPRWSVEPHRWSNGFAGLLTSVDFAKGVTGGGAPITVREKPNGVEFSFVSSGSTGVGRTFSHEVTAQMRDGKCIMSGPATMFPGKATTIITMVPR